MFRVDWASPKITLNEFDYFLSSYLSSNFDGITLENQYVNILTITPLTSEQESYILDFLSSFNNQPKEVVTQYEKNDKDLKLAKAKANIDSETKKAIISIKVPGEFGVDGGRYVAGGYAFIDSYNADDYATVVIEDTDRLIAWAVALALDPEAVAPISDNDIIAYGVLPSPIGQAFPTYPIIKSYTEDEAEPENNGWFFWPVSLGSNLDPIGECEVEPIGGYGHCPSGMYLKLTVQRTIGSGTVRVNFYWGKKE